MKHQPNPDEPDRCLASDLLITDCSGCRGSDESFVDALLAGEPEPDADYGVPDEEPTPEEEREALGLRSVHGDFALRTGKPARVVATSRPFRSKYYGSPCRLCPDAIQKDQYIVRLHDAAYAHLDCYEKAATK